jgi:LysW-gamma-L-lysine carboxypeptidase
MSVKSDINFLEEILKIYSPSRCEDKLADYLQNKMEKLLFKNVKKDKVGNIIGEIGTGSPVILLCGHMDTVPGKIPVKNCNNIIYGRGAVDAKSSLAAMILASSRLEREKECGKIIVSGVVDEEGSGLGIKEIIKNGIKTDYIIFGEPSGSGNVTIGYKGRVCLKILNKTKSYHASSPWLSENAIEIAFEMWKKIIQYVNSKQVKKSLYNSLSASLTKIKGGFADNVNPNKCEITVDLRIPPQLSCNSILYDLKELLDLFKKDRSFDFSIKILDETEPFETDKNSILIKAINRAIFRIKGKRPLLLKKTGTGDMNVLGNTLKCPVITYGPGNSHLSHTEEEYIEVEEYLSSIEIYKNTIMELKNLVSNHNLY